MTRRRNERGKSAAGDRETSGGSRGRIEVEVEVEVEVNDKSGRRGRRLNKDENDMNMEVQNLREGKGGW